MAVFQLYIDNEELDLFKDETFVLNSSVQNINDISKIFTDFSQTFVLPATAKNNRLFKHYYNAHIIGGFDARTKKTSRIELSKNLYKEGKLRLTSVQMSGKKPVSYSVTFFGDLVSLTDRFGSDLINTLDLSAYNHEYSYDKVKDGLTGDLFSGDVIYPLISSGRRFYYDSDPSDVTNTETNVNISHNVSGQVNGIEWDELKPAIKVMELVKAIEIKYGVTFSDDFLDDSNAALSNLYLWLSNQEGNLSAGSSDVIDLVVIDLGAYVSGDDYFIDYSNNKFFFTLKSKTTPDASLDDYNDDGIERAYMNIAITPAAGFESVEYALYISYNGEEPTLISSGLTGYNYHSETFRFYSNGSINGTSQVYILPNEYMEFSVDHTARIEAYKRIPQGAYWTWQSTAEQLSSNPFTSTLNNIYVSSFLPSISVLDFFSGLIKMFNLVIIPNSETDFYIDTLENYYASGDTVDISKFLEPDNTISRGNVVSNINFGFQDGSTILIDKYKSLTGKYYGNQDVDIKDDEGDNLDGNPIEVLLPFENMLFERLRVGSSATKTNIVVGLSSDSELKPVLTEPILFYGIENNVSSNDIALKSSGGAVEKITEGVFMPFHVNNTTTKAHSTVFDAEIEEFTEGVITNTLYLKYYSEYITASFSPLRRIYKFSGVFNNKLLTTVKLNDTIIINEQAFTINSMKITLPSKKVDLELINKV